LLGSPLKICGEVELRIHQFLMGGMDASTRSSASAVIRKSLAQCRGWLDEHLPEVERMPVSSNAEGARRARDERAPRHRRRDRRRCLRPQAAGHRDRRP
jgi:chorismate mutase/prephenate dehydratase